MSSGQHKSTHQQSIFMPQQSTLLTRHPVLTPVLLIGGAIGLCIVSFFADNLDSLFPLLSLISVPSALLSILLALVLGISGVLAAIISIIERVDRNRLRAEVFPQPKERSYGN